MKYPLKAIIVEDRDDDLLLLKKLLSRYEKLIQISQEFTTYELAKVGLLSSPVQFDLSFLDIELDNNKECYELIDSVGLKEFGIIVFSTRVQSVPLKYTAGKGNYLYLPKPYSIDGVSDFIQKLKEDIDKKACSNSKTSQPKKLSLSTKKGNIFLSQESIIYIYVVNNLCTIFYLQNGILKKYIATAGVTLTQYEDELDSSLFHRLESKYLVNTNFIQRTDDGSIFLQYLDDRNINKEIPIPLKGTKKTSLLSRFLKIKRKG